MPKKYHVHTQTAPPRFKPVGKYATIEFREDCAGSCRDCVKKACVYNIFEETHLHERSMDEPEYLYACKSCFRCIQQCTKGIFSRVVNPEYRSLGDRYFKPDVILRTWFQAHTGKIPVSGAGYRGPFVGEGFDTLWTDMSEIVRPTRDGIHGREYISTCIELSRRQTQLKFGKDLSLLSDVPTLLELPLPVLFQEPEFGFPGENVLLSAAEAAHALETMMFLRAGSFTPALEPYKDALIPCLRKGTYERHSDLIRKSRMVELAYEPEMAQDLEALRSMHAGVCISVGIPLDEKAASRALELTHAGVDTLHFYADNHGNERRAESPRFLKETIAEIHNHLVDELMRQRVNLLFSGGIAMAEHMAKAIICGADGVTVDYPLLIALECRMCRRCEQGLSCPVHLDRVEPEWGRQRILNLMGAWRNQLIEVMGAMGIREVRRMRGEVGRSMCFEDLERENFGPLFGERKVSGLGI